MRLVRGAKKREGLQVAKQTAGENFTSATVALGHVESNVILCEAPAKESLDFRVNKK